MYTRVSCTHSRSLLYLYLSFSFPHNPLWLSCKIHLSIHVMKTFYISANSMRSYCDLWYFRISCTNQYNIKRYMYTRVQVQAHSVWSKWCSFFITLPKCTSYIQIFNRVFFMELLIFVTSSSNTNRLKYSHWFWKTNFGILSVNRHKSVCVV